MSDRWYLGDPAECPHQPGLARIPWTDMPARDELGEIRKLTLRPSPSQLLPAVLPEWIAELPACRELVVPLLYLPTLRADRLPVGLDALVFDADYRWRESATPRWPSALILPELRELGFHGHMLGAPEGLRAEHVPALERLAASLDDKADLIDRIVAFPRLRALDLANLGVHDVFESLDGAIEALTLRGGGRRFPFDAIRRWPTIERLELVGMQGEVDCAVLSELPELAELGLRHCKKLVELEALLDCPRLRALAVAACGRPFTPALRQAFAEHGFDQLEIDRA
ncbi:hypothetical protein ACNOYE_13175 [Nannocystaceae bacterium ST9]